MIILVFMQQFFSRNDDFSGAGHPLLFLCVFALLHSLDSFYLFHAGERACVYCMVHIVLFRIERAKVIECCYNDLRISLCLFR